MHSLQLLIYSTTIDLSSELLFDLSGYINSPSLSDVVLVSQDGAKCHAHRLVLCAQSPVFKTMMDSDLWAESRNKEVGLEVWYISVHILILNLQPQLHSTIHSYDS